MSPVCGGFYQGECRVGTCAVHITASLHGNSHLAVSGATVCVCAYVHRILNQCPWITRMVWRHQHVAHWWKCEMKLHTHKHPDTQRRSCTIKMWHFSFHVTSNKARNIVKAVEEKHMFAGQPGTGLWWSVVRSSRCTMHRLHIYASTIIGLLQFIFCLYKHSTITQNSNANNLTCWTLAIVRSILHIVIKLF